MDTYNLTSIARFRLIRDKLLAKERKTTTAISKNVVLTPVPNIKVVTVVNKKLF
jgi:hypothetical protein